MVEFYKTRATTEIITSNKTVMNDSFSSIYVKNIGEDKCFLLDNVLIGPGESFEWTNEPNVIITDNIQVTFEGVEADKRIVFMKKYFDKFNR